MTTEERLGRLERENRWMKLGGAVLLLALVAVLFVGAGQEEDTPKVIELIRARKLELVNEHGAISGWLYADPGKSGLILRDPYGKGRISMTAGSRESSVHVVGKNGGSEVSLSVNPYDMPGVHLLDKGGNMSITLYLDPDWMPSLFFGTSPESSYSRPRSSAWGRGCAGPPDGENGRYSGPDWRITCPSRCMCS